MTIQNVDFYTKTQADAAIAAAKLGVASVDDAVEALVLNPASDTSAALSSRYAPLQRAMPRGPRFAAIGDSVIAAGVGVNERLFGVSIQSNVAWRSEGRLNLVRNAGVAGNTTTQMLARFDTDVTPWHPDVVLIRGGVNDTNDGTTLATFQANIIAMVNKCYTIGAVPILDTITPVDYAGTTQNAKIVAWNQWLLSWGHINGVRVANSWARACAGTGYTWPDSTYTSDGLHPTAPKGQKVIADAILTEIQDLPKFPFKRSELASGTLLTTGLFTPDTNADGIADSWAVASGGTATSPTYATSTDANIVGKIQKITLPAQTASKASTLEQHKTVAITTHYVAGDLIRVSALVRVISTDPDPLDTLRGELVLFSWNGGASDVITYIFPTDCDTPTGFARVSFEYRARTSANDVEWVIQFSARTGTLAGSAGGQGSVEVAEVEVVNLTRHGLAPTYPWTP